MLSVRPWNSTIWRDLILIAATAEFHKRVMRTNHEPKHARTVARSLALLAFSIMTVVSVVVYYTEDHLTMVDYILIVCGPFALGALAYFVGLHHDPAASD